MRGCLKTELCPEASTLSEKSEHAFKTHHLRGQRPHSESQQAHSCKHTHGYLACQYALRKSLSRVCECVCVFSEISIPCFLYSLAFIITCDSLKYSFVFRPYESSLSPRHRWLSTGQITLRLGSSQLESAQDILSVLLIIFWSVLVYQSCIFGPIFSPLI